MPTEQDKRFVIEPSRIPGAGRGLFANERLEVGDELLVVGVLIEAGGVSDDCTRFADHYKFRVGDHLLIPTGFGAMVNHSEEAANVEKRIVGDEVRLRTLRAIEAGEEILLCYRPEALERMVLSQSVNS